MGKKTQTVTIEKLLSKKTAEKLDEALSKGNIEQLKKHMEKLFTFKNIFNMHDDHIIELAECIVDLAEVENTVEYAKSIEQYARKRIFKYQMRKKQVTNEIQWAKASKNIDKVKMLDLEYRMKVYDSGFEYSKFHMYSMLCRIIQDIKASKKGSDHETT